MLQEKLKNYHIILGSGSPRRQELLKELGIHFEIRLKETEEIYSKTLRETEISDTLAQLKATPFKNELQASDILITADTIVWFNEKALEKPKNEQDAFNMLQELSGNHHKVITSVCFTTTTSQKTVNATTKVHFKSLTDEEIQFYIKNYKPFDKAGAYGIQEWIGLMGIEKITGSYTNVVGLPTQLVYKTLLEIISL